LSGKQLLAADIYLTLLARSSLRELASYSCGPEATLVALIPDGGRSYLSKVLRRQLDDSTCDVRTPESGFRVRIRRWLLAYSAVCRVFAL
jgi:hypothetical protein